MTEGEESGASAAGGMTPDRWRRVRELFAAAAELDAAAAEALLAARSDGDADLRREVESLLAAHRAAAGGFISRPAARLAAPPAASAAPERVGPYRVIAPLGSGGMGTVYLAERDDEVFRKRVAVKVLRRGVESGELQARFRAERQILARLEHPNIARILDGGTTDDGLPYLVLEHVEGEPIDRWCRSHQATVRQRLELILKVADALQYAHRNLIIHRDLKPGNVLVTAAGEPKLLDFGIAKLLEPSAAGETVLETVVGLAPMTPEYASPEQVRGEPVTTASDVYSLGVVLYQLLTGRRPYRVAGRSRREVEAAVLDSEPLRPSTAVVRDDVASGADGAPPPSPELRKRLAGDLDAIVLRALRKEPEARYGSVDQLADDLRRHLDGQPVRARSGTWRYRAGKFLRRNRLAVAAAAAIALLVLAFLATLLVQRGRILRQQARAEEVAEFLVGLFASADPELSRGEQLTVREVLQDATARLRTELTAQPERRADLLLTLGRSYGNLGLHRAAKASLGEALALYRALRSAQPIDEALTLYHLAEVLQSAGELERARDHAAEASVLLQHHLPAADPAVVAALTLEGRIAARLGDLDGADRLVADAIVRGRRGVADDGGDDAAEALAEALEERADILRWRGDEAASDAHFRESVTLLREIHGEDHPEVPRAYNDLALLLRQRQELAEAEVWLRRAVAIQRRLYAEPHPSLATSLSNLGAVLHDRGDTAAAEAATREARELLRAIFGDRDHALVVHVLLEEARQEIDRDAEAARRLYREALAMQRRLLPRDHPDLVPTLNNLARSLLRLERPDEALRLYEEALRISRLAYGKGHRQTATVLANLGDVLVQLDRRAEARARLEEALAILRRSDDAERSDLTLVLHNLGMWHWHDGDPAAAETYLAESLTIEEKSLGSLHPDVARRRAGFAALALRLERPEEAARQARLALDGLREAVPATDPWRRSALGTLVRALREEGRESDEAAVLRQAAEELAAEDALGSDAGRWVLDRLVALSAELGRTADVERYRALGGEKE